MTKLAVKRPLMTIVVFIILILAGVFSYRALPVDLYPDISIPTLSVIAIYPGASAEDVEGEIIETMEEAFVTVRDVKDVTSVAQENLGAVILNFAWGTDLDAATNEVRDKLDFFADELPDDMERPQVLKFDISIMPVLIMAAVSDNPGIDLRKLMEDEITEKLNRVEGVASASVWGGGYERQINVKLDKTRLEGYGLSIATIVDILEAENVAAPAGNAEVSSIDYLVRVPGKFETVDEIRNVPLMTGNGEIIRLGDVARVEDGFAEVENHVRVNGKDAVYFGVSKRSDANTVEVAGRVLERLETLRAEYPEIDLVVIRDLSDFIEASVNNLTRTILIAIGLVILVTLVLLANFRASLIIAVTIPTSLVVGYIFLYATGATVNIISLSAIAIAIGMVVDNAIVVTENIFEHRRRGGPKKEASINGAQEVGQAILASTFTTVSIFLPLLLVRGFVGIIFKELALTVPIVLLASLFSSLTLTPVLASKFLKVRMDDEPRKKFALSRLSEKGFAWLEKRYSRVLGWVIGHKLITSIVAVVVFVLGMSLFQFVKTEFFPTSDEGYFEAVVEMPVGTRLEVTDSVVREFEELVTENVPEAEIMLGNSGSAGGFAAAFGQTQTSASGGVTVLLESRSERDRTVFEIVDDLNERVDEMPGLRQGFFTYSEQGGPDMMGGKPVSIEIYGHDFALTDSIARLLKDRLEANVSGISGLTVSRTPGRPEIWLELDRDRIRQYGLTTGQVASYLRMALYGVAATKYQLGGERYDVFVSLEDSVKKSRETLESLHIPTPLGVSVPLANITDVVTRQGPLSIERKDRERVVYVEADITGRALGEVISDVAAEIREIEIPIGVEVGIAGQAEEQQESFQTMFLALVIGIILVYLVMVAQFESFLNPFVVMFAVPFAMVGVSAAFYLTGMPLSLMGFVGVILLVGVVVNNAIVLVDYINILRYRGYEMKEAILEAGPRRLRPVLMTTLTTVFGLLPLAISRAEGAELWNALGVAVVGGLLFATFVTLLLVPVIYAVVGRRIQRREEVI
jgi:HAE1 family hydrophobic/amphiphilic exporter-1